MTTITSPTYAALDEAYRFFNERLWGGKLPTCAITMQRKKGAYGYFHAEQIGLKADDASADEIALNPDTFRGRELRDVLGTLAHEMAHLWQHHNGKPSRNAYHNREWGTEMKRIGLHPTATGEIGGKETGQKVTHVIVDGGAFDVACADFLKTHGPEALNWYSKGRISGSAAAKRASKTKYTCPECKQNAWAKPESRLICGDCECEMEVA